MVNLQDLWLLSWVKMQDTIAWQWFALPEAQASNLRAQPTSSLRTRSCKNWTKLIASFFRLLQAAAEAEKGDSAAFRSTVVAIRDDHVQAAKAEITSPKIIEDLGLRFQTILQDLLSVLLAASTLGEVSSRTLDIIVGIGEILSCQYVTAILQDRGVDAQLVDLSNIKPVEAPRGPDQALYDAYAIAICHRILECGPRIPIITGFFGPFPGGLLGHVGRGYTDLCAALVAVGLSALELQIWKECVSMFNMPRFC